MAGLHLFEHFENVGVDVKDENVETGILVYALSWTVI